MQVYTMNNLMDAFKALEDVEDDDKEFLKALKESRSFDIRSPKEMEEAEEFMKPVKKEVKLEVIDPDADSVQHLKDNEDYVGQMILQCAVCKSKIFLDADKLQPSEADEDLYNTDIECPHCHKEGRGYTLLGQVGKVPEEEISPAIENDSLTNDEDEAKFGQEEAPVEAEEEEVAVEKEPEESSDSLTDNEPEPKFGDEEEPKAEEEPDQPEEEAPEAEDAEAEAEDAESDQPSSDDEIKKVDDEEDEDETKNESLVEDVELPSFTVADFFDKFVAPENIKMITIWKISDDEEERVYESTYEDMPESFKEEEIKVFDVDGGKLTLNTDLTADSIEGQTLGDILKWFNDEFDEDIAIEDAEQGEIFVGTKGSILNDHADLPLTFMNAPERVNIYCENVAVTESLKTIENEDFDLANDEDRLIVGILKGCGYNENRANIMNTPEYWIAQSIRDREDLKTIYDDYVCKCSPELKNAFKDVTGYADAVDEAIMQEEQVSEKVAASTPSDMDQSIEKAKELLKSSNAYAVIYGYQKNGKFFGFKDPIVCKDSESYRDKAEIVNLRYRPTGSVSTLFHNVIAESVEVNSRKALTELIMECKNNKQPYSIKSKGNGKYVLLKESPAPLVSVNNPEVEAEVVDRTPAIRTETERAVVDPRDQELVDKLVRIAKDTANAIRDTYDVTVDERAILADIIQDLQLISGQLRPEMLPRTPANEVTKQMYAAYEGFYDAMDDMRSFVSGRPMRTSQMQKISQALQMLDSAEFTADATRDRIASRPFQLAMTSGAVPGIGQPEDVRLIEGVEKCCDDPECKDCEECDVCEEDFERFINNMLDESVEETILLRCDNIKMNENKEVIINGTLLMEDGEEDKVTFTLKPSLKESSGKIYTVTNTLTEEVFTFKPGKVK